MWILIILSEVEAEVEDSLNYKVSPWVNESINLVFQGECRTSYKTISIYIRTLRPAWDT